MPYKKDIQLITEVEERRQRCCFNPSRPNPRRREKIKLNFYFHILCGASKGFMRHHKEV